jgi:YVTN family beta-propeller protein
MEFRMLGPLEVLSDGQALDLGGAKQRTLLAVLLLDANSVVSRDRLIDALWEDEPPETAQKALQVYVSGLRKLIGPERLRTRAPGYLLDLEGDEVDLERFRALQAQGRLAEALSLWRGPPLSDLADRRFAQAEVARLVDLHLACQEERIEQDLQARRHAELTGELEALVAEHPLRERLRCQLMLALYRSGRQAEALDAYQAARRTLVEELGIEPGRELRELHQRILNQDPDLDLPDPATDLESLGVQAGVEPRQRLLTKRVRWLLLTSAVLILGSVTALLVEILGRNDNQSVVVVPNSLGAIDASSGKVVAVTPVGDTPTSVVVDRDAVWVLNSGEQTLSRVDPKSHSVLRTIPAGSSPSDLAVRGGSIWVASSAFGLSQIDVDSGALLHTIELPSVPNPLARGADASWVATDAAAVWATGDGSATRVRPSAVHAVPGGLGCCNGIAIGYGSVWVTDDAGITRLDARTGARLARIPLPFAGSRIAAGAGAVWVIDPNGNSVWAIDPRTDQVLRTVNVGPNPQGVAVGARSVWVATAGGDVARIDPTAFRVVDTIPIGGTPAGIAVGLGQVWITIE